MDYYIDAEFLEGTQRKRILGIPALGLRWDENDCLEIFKSQTKPTIDLISIGIVSEDNREYYAVSKDFNLWEAWNRYDLKTEQVYGDMRNIYPEGRKYKDYWIRENVLKPIWQEYCYDKFDTPLPFKYKNMKWVIEHFGKTNKQIAEEIKEFAGMDYIDGYGKEFTAKVKCDNHYIKSNPQFYGYYSAYDHVALCWLFGKMIDLPKGFPMYTRDLKQELDNTVYPLHIKQNNFNKISGARQNTYEEALFTFKTRKDYPKQTNEHNALADARWNKQLHEFLQKA